MKAAVVIPVHNEAPTIRALADGIRAHIGTEDLHIFFVDDGSTDATLQEIRNLRSEDPRVHFLRFVHNAGKTRALAAAFRRVKADLVITMDGDLQDDPTELPRMLEALKPGVDVVCGWKQDRQDPWHKTGPSLVFNRSIAAAFGLTLHDMNSGFKVIRGEVARRLPMSEGMHRFIPVLAKQLGYTVIEIPVKHHPRRHGKSKYGWKRYWEGLRDALWLWFHPAPSQKHPPEEPGLVAEES